MRKLAFVMLLALPLGCQPADAPSAPDSNATSAVLDSPAEGTTTDDAGLTQLFI
jgi:hypothetical protein